MASLSGIKPHKSGGWLKLYSLVEIWEGRRRSGVSSCALAFYPALIGQQPPFCFLFQTWRQKKNIATGKGSRAITSLAISVSLEMEKNGISNVLFRFAVAWLSAPGEFLKVAVIMFVTTS